MPRLTRFSLLAAILLVQPAAAQEVAGMLVDSRGAPLPISRVVLLDSAGTRVSSTLTRADGGFRLAAPAAGSYRVRAERVGFASTTSAALRLQAGTATPLRLVAGQAAVTLEGITARGGSARCRLARESGAATAMLWDEARKALEATEGARGDESVQFELVSYRRELEAGSMAIIREDRSQRAMRLLTSPFIATPLDTLLQKGFVRPRGDSVSWDAPDAEVLLSPRFQATHCLHATEHPDSASLIGLGFQPVGNRLPSDVTGTLWLDRATAELRYLEYRYVNAGYPGRHPRVGGRVDFERLASGLWVVRRWWIRIPAVDAEAVFAAPGPFRLQPRITRIVEVGGEIFGAGVRSPNRGSGRITGVVWDSVAGAPLAGAEVSALGTPWVAYTDSAGRFVIPAMPAGTYSVTFTHSRQAATGFARQPVIADLSTDTVAEVALAVHGERSMLARHCPGLRPDLGLIAGIVLRESDPVPGATVEVQWAGLGGDRASVLQRVLRTTTEADGTFVFCEVPMEVQLEVRARSGEQHTSGTTILERQRVMLYPVRL